MAAGAANILYLDPRPLMADILARPSAYGITNTTLPACGTAASLGCVPPAATAGFFFADGVHPGTAVHGILSDWVYSTRAAPNQFAQLASLPIGRSGAQWRAMDDRMRGFETDTRADARGWFATVDYSPARLSANGTTPALSGNGMSLTLGVDARWDHLIGGLALGVAETSFDMGGNAGTIESAEMILSAFGAAKFGAAYVDGLASYGRFDYDTQRRVSATTNSGSTKADHFGFKLGAGYNFTSGALTHGPVASLSLERVSVDGFTENGTTELDVGKQTRTSLRHRIGWQAVWRTQVGEAQVSPYLRITHEREYKDNPALPTVSQVGSGFAFSAPTHDAKDNWGLIAAGANIKVGGANVQFGEIGRAHV
jgi:outer membrane lipase/esterase